MYVRSGPLNTMGETRATSDHTRSMSGGSEPDPRLIAAVLAGSPPGTGSVRVIATSAAWVVLHGGTAWKCRRHRADGERDLASLAACRAACAAELSLNQRFAPEIYQGLWALRTDGGREPRLVPAEHRAEGQAASVVGGMAHDTAAGAVEGIAEHAAEGTAPIDWAIRMRRLPSAGFLEARLIAGRAGPADAARVAQALAALHAGLPRSGIDGRSFVQRFIDEIQACAPVLDDAPLLQALRARTLAVAALLEERVGLGQIVDGHGDLRPAHLHLSGLARPGATPRVLLIDALDCAWLLRQVDPWEELSLLALLAGELGAAWFGPRLLAAYIDRSEREPRTGAPHRLPSPSLLSFYTAYHAIVRARLAAAHLRRSPVRRAAHWRALARRLCAAARAALDGWCATG